jgi:hypothetical protein
MYTEIENVVTSTGKMIEPVRRSLFKRFPVTLTLFVTFGIAATFFGIERIIAEITWLNEHPTAILLMGLSILIFTGKLYQKLG